MKGGGGWVVVEVDSWVIPSQHPLSFPYAVLGITDNPSVFSEGMSTR